MVMADLMNQLTTLLLIYDAPHVREVLRLALESEGYLVIEAADGREGVAMFRQHHPAVTIVDIVMPEKDGIETVREILAIDPAAVIFTMSGADANYQFTAKMMGARGGFRKPVRLSELLNAVNNACLPGDQPPPWIPDPSRIVRNPYGHRVDEGERVRVLANDLLVFARAFEYPAEEEFHDGISRYIEKHGDADYIALAFAVRHVDGVEYELRTIRECTAHHRLSRIDRVNILLHIGLIELVESHQYMGFHEWLQGRLKVQTLPDVSTRSRLKDYLSAQHMTYVEDHGASRAFRRALGDGLTDGDKVTLLHAFAFSKEHQLGEDAGDVRHLQCAEREARGKRIDPFCGDYCLKPTSEESTRLIPKLANHLYNMRSAFVHNASGVGFAATNEPLSPGIQGRMFFDAFFTAGRMLTRYQVTIELSRLTKMFRRCVWARITRS
jgi:CheY-like chemotaxis protein